MTNDELRNIILSRTYFFQVLHVLFGQKPTVTILQALFESYSLATLRNLGYILTSDATSQYTATLNNLERFELDYLQKSNGHLDSLLKDYTRLFVGPNALAAPPWELVYKTGERLLFQPKIVVLKNLYASEGSEPVDQNSVSYDHIAIEFDFMRFLSEKSLTFIDSDSVELKRLFDVQRTFISEHLISWLPDYCSDLAAAAQLPFYPLVATLALNYLSIDLEFLSQP
jgi:TorA maturation chaperone TorD